MPERKEILVAGYINMDLVAYIHKPLKPGDRITANQIESIPGGMAANCACTAAKLGATVNIFGTVGIDEYGQKLLVDLQAFGVGTDWVKIDGSRNTSRCLIHVLPTGERCITSEKLNFDYTPLENYLSSSKVEEAGILHLDGYRISDCPKVAQLARSRGVLVSVDLDGIDKNFKTARKSLKHVDIAFMNRSTMQLLVEESNPEKALPAISKLGPGIVVVTLGEDGAALFYKSHFESVPGHRVKVYDTIGAGDDFDGAFLSRYTLSGDPEVSLRFSNATAAISVTGRGAKGHLPNEAEVLALLKGK